MVLNAQKEIFTRGASVTYLGNQFEYLNALFNYLGELFYFPGVQTDYLGTASNYQNMICILPVWFANAGTYLRYICGKHALFKILRIKKDPKQIIIKYTVLVFPDIAFTHAFAYNLYC